MKRIIKFLTVPPVVVAALLIMGAFNPALADCTVDGSSTACPGGDLVGTGSDNTIVVGEPATGSDTVGGNVSGGTTSAASSTDVTGGGDAGAAVAVGDLVPPPPLPVSVTGLPNFALAWDADMGQDTIQVASAGAVDFDVNGDVASAGASATTDASAFAVAAASSGDADAGIDAIAENIWANTGGGVDDTLIIDGTVGGNVNGDLISASASASGVDVACSMAGAEGGDDTIIINGVVTGDVNGDNVTASASSTATNPSVGVAMAIAVAEGGNDSITISGSVGGNVNGDNLTVSPSANGSPGVAVTAITGGDDTVTLLGDAAVGGTIDGGPHGAGDTLNFNLAFTNSSDLAMFNSAFNDVPNKTVQSGFGTAVLSTLGRIYEWVNFEIVTNNSYLIVVETADGETFTIDCGPSPYLFNEVSGQYQRSFNMFCEPITGDPNESLYHGLFLDQTPLAS